MAIKKYQNRALILICPGLVLQWGSLLLAERGFIPIYLGSILILFGTVLFCVGLGFGAKAKGHSGIVGFAGLAGFFGLVYLFMLEDNCPEPVVLEIKRREFRD